jgi:hypothetical protein
MKEHFTSSTRVTAEWETSRSTALQPLTGVALSVFFGMLLAQNQSPPARPTQSPVSPKSAVRANSPADAAEKPAPSPTGGADLRANNPFTLPEGQRPPLSTSGAR